jgi:hypothetical protein
MTPTVLGLRSRQQGVTIKLMTQAVALGSDSCNEGSLAGRVALTPTESQTIVPQSSASPLLARAKTYIELMQYPQAKQCYQICPMYK